MTIAALTTGVQTVTDTGAITPTTGLDISGISADMTIKVRVSALTAAKKARIVLEDSVNGFTAAVPVAEINIVGPIVSGANRTFSFKSNQDIPGLRKNVSNGVLRLNVVSIDSASSLSLDAWAEY